MWEKRAGDRQRGEECVRRECCQHLQTQAIPSIYMCSPLLSSMRAREQTVYYQQTCHDDTPCTRDIGPVPILKALFPSPPLRSIITDSTPYWMGENNVEELLFSPILSCYVSVYWFSSGREDVHYLCVGLYPH